MAKSKLAQKIAEERIDVLYSIAVSRFKEDTPDSISLGRKYIKRAKELSMHYKVVLPDEIKKRTCKKCGNLLIPGVNCKVIIASSKGYVIRKCRCGHETHVFYK